MSFFLLLHLGGVCFNLALAAWFVYLLISTFMCPPPQVCPHDFKTPSLFDPFRVNF